MDLFALERFLTYFVSLFFRLLELALIVHILMSWFANGRTPLGMAVERLIQPLLRPFSWARVGAFQFAPLIFIFALYFVRDFLLRIISTIA